MSDLARDTQHEGAHGGVVIVIIVVVSVHRDEGDAAGVWGRRAWRDSAGFDRAASCTVAIAHYLEQVQVFTLLVFKHEFFTFVGPLPSVSYCLGQQISDSNSSGADEADQEACVQDGKYDANEEMVSGLMSGQMLLASR